MKITTKHLLVALACTSFVLASCGGNRAKKDETTPVGHDTDQHGCIASAGYTWSEVQKECIRLWEKGVRMTSVEDAEKTLFLVFSPDSAQVELFFSEEEVPNEILDRRNLPNGGHAWNVEDDDTKNVRIENGKWTVSRRGGLIYRQAE